MSRRKPWTRNQKLIFWGLIIAGIAAITPFAVRFVPQRTRMDKEEIEKIVEKVVADYLQEHGEDLQGFQPEGDQLKAELTKALERTNSLAAKGNRTDAAKALKDLRKRGDLSSLQQMLIKERNKNRDMLVERNREIAYVAYLRGDLDTSSAAMDEILKLRPNDMGALKGKGHICFLRTELDQAEDWCQRVLQSARKLRDQRGQAETLGSLGRILGMRGDLDKAEQIHLKALEIDREIAHLDGMAGDYADLAALYQVRGDLEEAEQMHIRSLETYEKASNSEGMARQYAGLGLVYQDSGDIEKAEEMYLKSLENDQEVGRIMRVTIYGNLGLLYVDRGELDKAKQMLRRLQKIRYLAGPPHLVAKKHTMLGLMYEKQGNLDKAKEMYNKVIQIGEQLGGADSMAHAYGGLGKIHQTQGDFDKTEEMFQKALEISKRAGMMWWTAVYYTSLGLAYEQRGYDEKAGECAEKSLELYKKIGMKREIENIEQMQRLIEKKQKLTEELKREDTGE